MIEWWMFGTYLAGSVVTYYLFVIKPQANVIEVTIDKLIADGFLRSKVSKDGVVEILKWNEK
jgi:hypothetical protein